VLGLGLLRRLLSGAPEESKSPASGTPWYLRSDGEVEPERIEAARQRLKKTIPPPEPDEPEPAP
jgi:hypothetical protein